MNAVDFSGAYWRCADRSTDTVIRMNGCNLNYSHYVRVIEARLAREFAVPAVLLVPRTTRPARSQTADA